MWIVYQYCSAPVFESRDAHKGKGPSRRHWPGTPLHHHTFAHVHGICSSHRPTSEGWLFTYQLSPTLSSWQQAFTALPAPGEAAPDYIYILTTRTSFLNLLAVLICRALII